MIALDWLPASKDWSNKIESAKSKGKIGWNEFVDLASSKIDLIKTEKIDRVVGRIYKDNPPDSLVSPVIRLAIASSCTVGHLLPSIRVAAIRRGMWVETYVCEYGQYFQELQDDNSPLWQFSPNVVLLSLDAQHLLGRPLKPTEDARDVVELGLERIALLWAKAREKGAQVIQQTMLPVFPPLAGSNEQRIAWSPRAMTAAFNGLLASRANDAGVDLLSLDLAIEQDGLRAWHDTALWHRAKQDIHPIAAPAYGDLVMRIVAARAGRSAKCLVLDLDNTLWGGVIGDDGLQGIVIGQGNPLGEAHLALQAYARNLSKRGVILAVCSKNDEANALEPFEKHPDMLLRRDDIACFVANWDDKATNLRRIAAQLNIGLDSLLFVDDNPFERNIVRRELPMVMVPELGDDPSGYVEAIASSGWFESIALTQDDLARARQYQANAQREAAKTTVTDMDAYLRSLDMELDWRGFDQLGLARIAQLINKSNQFNLTTRRYTEAEVGALIPDPDAISLQLRLRDTFGDNGMISVLIARKTAEAEAEIDTWLMSCRVLGRGVESAALNLLVAQAKAKGVKRLIGRYLPTAKNSMVADHYDKLGFEMVDQDAHGASRWQMNLDDYVEQTVFMVCKEG